jgi:hypothetical protein
MVRAVCAVVQPVTNQSNETTRKRSEPMFVCALLGAAAVGFISFVAGFVGPIIITPDSNQGPLLGIFITGPLGAIVGAIGGVIYFLVRRARMSGSTGR